MLKCLSKNSNQGLMFMEQEPVSTFSMIIYLTLILGFFIILVFKKRNQVGKTWDGPIGAEVTIGDKILTCSHCGHNKFSKREGLLTTTWITLFLSPFWNRSARCFHCKNCGYLHWFIRSEEKAEIERSNVSE